MATSCEDQLNQAPISAIGDNGFYTSTDEIEAAVVAIYDGMQQSVLREFALTEMRSDNTRTKSSEGEWAQFEDMNVTATNGTVSSYWSAEYNIIFRANKVLENLDVVDDSAKKIQFEGEAKFARAMAHFNLVRAFGDVPYIDKVIIQTEQDYFKRTSASEVLGNIVNDLNDAIGELPSRGNIDEGRATKGAAQALLAKVYLTQHDYSSAKGLLDQLVSDADYSLVDNYHDVFYNELNSEIIFAIEYVNDDVSESQDFSLEFTALGVASGLNYVTDNFKNSIDPVDTVRMATLYNPSNDAEVGKFITSSSDATLCGNDWIVLRLADVLLMHAEAILAGGDATSDAAAIASYNMVRTRAGMSTLPTDGTGSLTKQMLLDERRVELAFENHRLYDLIRFGEADNVLSAFANEEGFVYESSKLLLPIPQREIDTSFGELSQNPGYN